MAISSEVDGRDGDRPKGQARRWLFATTLAVLVLAVVAAQVVTLTLLAGVRADLDGLERVKQSHSAELDDHAQALDYQAETTQALGRAVVAGQGLGQRLDSLESALFGFGGPSFRTDVVGDLERQIEGLRACVNELVRDLVFGSSFLQYC